MCMIARPDVRSRRTATLIPCHHTATLYRLRFSPSSGRHSSDRLGIGVAVAKGWGAERGGERCVDASRFSAKGWECSVDSLGCQEDIFHGIDGRGEAAAEASSWNRETHLYGAGRKRALCGESTWSGMQRRG